MRFGQSPSTSKTESSFLLSQIAPRLTISKRLGGDGSCLPPSDLGFSCIVRPAKYVWEVMLDEFLMLISCCTKEYDTFDASTLCNRLENWGKDLSANVHVVHSWVNVEKACAGKMLREHLLKCAT